MEEFFDAPSAREKAFEVVGRIKITAKNIEVD